MLVPGLCPTEHIGDSSCSGFRDLEPLVCATVCAELVAHVAEGWLIPQVADHHRTPPDRNVFKALANNVAGVAGKHDIRDELPKTETAVLVRDELIDCSHSRAVIAASDCLCVGVENV